MGAATVTEIGRISALSRLLLYSFTMTSIGAGGGAGSEEEVTGLPSKGRIRQVRATSGSTDFDLSIKTKTGASASTNYEIYNVEAINKHSDRSDLDVIYVNQDTTVKGSLYAKAKNDDGGNATGTISVQLAIEVMDQ